MEITKIDSYVIDNFQRFRDLFDNMSIGLTICKTDGHFINVNSPFCNITGYSEDELLTMSFHQITHPDHIEKDKDMIYRLLSGSIKNYSIEKRYIRKDKSIVWVKLYASVIPDKKNVPAFLIATIEEITRQKEVEANLTSSYNTINNILESISDAFVSLDKNWSYEYLNKKAGEIFGRDPKELIGKNIWLEFPLLINTLNYKAYHKSFETQQFYSFEEYHTASDKWYENRIYPSENRLSVFSTDITSRKKAEASIKKMYTTLTYILTQTSRKKGEEYFCSMVVALSEALNADFVHIGILQPDKEHIKTIALCHKNQILPNLEYCLSGSPCETVINNTGSYYQKNVMALFPKEETMKQLGIEGYLGTPLHNKYGDLIGLIVCLYQTPIEDIQFSETVVKLFCDRAVSEYEQLKYEDELIFARKKAEESDQLKTAFLQNMSHEIRTPMNVIVGFSDLLPKYYNDQEKIIKFSSIIKQRGEDLTKIINDILDIARIESGQFPLHYEECRLNQIIEEVEIFFLEYRERQKKEDIDFKIILHENIEQPIITDPGKLKQILINLIGNAFKFTTKGKIEIGCKIDDDQNISIYISDTGIGIAKEKQTEVFERFRQASTETFLNHGGSGLGLTIVKGLLDLLGGKIWLQSAETLGGTFFVSIPFKKIEDR